jgi:hypothetical protein
MHIKYECSIRGLLITAPWTEHYTRYHTNRHCIVPIALFISVNTTAGQHFSKCYQHGLLFQIPRQGPTGWEDRHCHWFQHGNRKIHSTGLCEKRWDQLRDETLCTGFCHRISVTKLVIRFWEIFSGVTQSLQCLWLQTGRSGFDPRQRQRIFSPLASMSRAALTPTQATFQRVPGVKRGRGVTLTTHVKPRSKMCKSYTPLPLEPAWR